MNWINGFVIGMAIGIVISVVMIVIFFLGDKFQKMRKSLVFVEHIEHHLENHPEILTTGKNPVVMCKICDMTIDDIYKLEGNKK